VPVLLLPSSNGQNVIERQSNFVLPKAKHVGNVVCYQSDIDAWLG
jgi:hypothetical protein